MIKNDEIGQQHLADPVLVADLADPQLINLVLNLLENNLKQHWEQAINDLSHSALATNYTEFIKDRLSLRSFWSDSPFFMPHRRYDN